jgi:hypothetical protein
VVVALTLRASDVVRPAGQQVAQRVNVRSTPASARSHPQHSAIIALQRAAGNAAITRLLTAQPRQDRLPSSLASAITVQRCGPVSCDCVSEDAATTFPTVQRDTKDDKKIAAPKDVVLILSPAKEKANALTEAAVVAPNGQVVFATSVPEMVERLKALKFPIKTLFFIGHSTADGDIVFETPDTAHFVPAANIAQAVKGVIQVESVDFRGCAVAVSPVELEKLRKAFKAKRGLGSTCELVKQVAGPIKTPGGAEITDPKTFDLSKAGNRTLFDKGFRMLHDAFGDERRKCILNDSEEGYFEAKGKLIAVWANPESIAGNNAFDKNKSICYGDLKTETIDPSKNPVIDENKCKLVELK